MANSGNDIINPALTDLLQGSLRKLPFTNFTADPSTEPTYNLGYWGHFLSLFFLFLPKKKGALISFFSMLSTSQCLKDCTHNLEKLISQSKFLVTCFSLPWVIAALDFLAMSSAASFLLLSFLIIEYSESLD